MIELFIHYTGWVWLALAVLSGAAALIVFKTLFLSVAGASLVLSMVLSVASMPYWGQGVLVVLLVGLQLIIYGRSWALSSPINGTRRLSKLASSVKGVKASLLTNGESGVQLVQIHDGIWKAQCEASVADGTLVEVIGHKGAVLNVSPVLSPKE